tara:strand:- start:1988 stop:2455 length:468 start_codon:yes stop_codon:yes gene_type:complete
MPLLPTTIQDLVQTDIMDASLEGVEITLDTWANVLGQWLNTDLPTFIVTAINPKAVDLTVASMTGPVPDGIPAIQGAFTSFGVTLASNAVGTGGPSVPPSVPFTIAPVVPAGMASPPAPSSTVSLAWATALISWLGSGIFFSGTPATPVPVAWVL